MKYLVTYCTFSGNTEEVAEIIEERLKEQGHKVDKNLMGIDPPINPKEYDAIFFGTFTWDYGKVPDETKDFIEEIGYKPDNMAIFGTGDTQFGGEELYCRAVDKLVDFYNSDWEGLKIEQSPRGSQEEDVILWVDNIMEENVDTQKETYIA